MERCSGRLRISNLGKKKSDCDGIIFFVQLRFDLMPHFWIGVATAAVAATMSP